MPSCDGDVAFPANKNVKYEREDISDILRSPLSFEKLCLESLQTLESKGVLKQLLEIQMTSAHLATSIKVANGSLDKQSSRKQELKESSDISFEIQSLATFEDDNNLRGIPVLPRGLDECGLKANRTYLVAGRMRGFGFEVACWMAGKGAKSIALLGHSKPSDAKCKELRQIERTTGAKNHAFQVGKGVKQCDSQGRRRLYQDFVTIELTRRFTTLFLDSSLKVRLHYHVTSC